MFKNASYLLEHCEAVHNVQLCKKFTKLGESLAHNNNNQSHNSNADEFDAYSIGNSRSSSTASTRNAFISPNGTVNATNAVNITSGMASTTLLNSSLTNNLSNNNKFLINNINNHHHKKQNKQIANSTLNNSIIQQQLIANTNKKAKTKHVDVPNQVYFTNGNNNNNNSSSSSNSNNISSLLTTNGQLNSNNSHTIAITTGAAASLLTGAVSAGNQQSKFSNANLTNLNNKFRNIKTTIASPILSTKIVSNASAAGNGVQRNNLPANKLISGPTLNTIKLSNTISNRIKIDDIKQHLIFNSNKKDLNTEENNSNSNSNNNNNNIINSHNTSNNNGQSNGLNSDDLNEDDHMNPDDDVNHDGQLNEDEKMDKSNELKTLYVSTKNASSNHFKKFNL